MAASRSTQTIAQRLPKIAAAPGPLLAAIGVTALFAFILLWMRQVNFYNDEFYSHGWVVTAYQLARLVLIPMLVWLVYSVGAGIAVLLCGRHVHHEVPAYERYPLYFLIGVGICHYALFVIGLAGFYVRPVAIFLGLAVMVLSIPHMSACIGELSTRITSRNKGPHAIAFGTFATAFLVLFVVFCLVRALYPLGPHDFYTHYFPYLTEVIQNGSLLPNHLWQHFYVSKGLSLFFFGMLLTDPLAPALVTAGFVGMGAWIGYALVRRSTDSPVIALAVALLYVMFFTIGNDDLEKQHCLTAVLLLGIVWTATAVFAWRVDNRKLWIFALCSACTATILITIELGFLIGLFILGFFLFFTARRDWRQASAAIYAGVTCGAAIGAILIINYLYTGLFLDQGVLYFWNFADPNKFIERNFLFEALMLRDVLASIAGAEQPWSWRLVPLLGDYLRLNIWWPLAIAALPFFILRLRSDRVCLAMVNKIEWGSWATLLWFELVVIVTALLGGRTQVDSFERMASFSYGPTLCLIALLFHTGFVSIDPAPRPVRTIAKLAVAILLIGYLAPMAMASTRRPEVTAKGLQLIFGNSARLLAGEFSLKEAYQNQQGWAGKLPWGGIYPGIETAWRIAGPGTPIFTFHIHAYCMLPDCQTRMLFTHRFGERWETPFIVFNYDADEAARALQADGVNYFFISNELELYSGVVVTPLFLPSEIAKHLAVRWTDGTSYLLTWPGPQTVPIDAAFLDLYTKRVNERYQSEKQSGELRKRAREGGRQFFENVQRKLGNLRPEDLCGNNCTDDTSRGRE